MSTNPESAARVFFILETDRKTIVYHPESRVVSEMTPDGFIPVPAHRDAFGVSTGYPMSPETEPEAGEMNTHPGPDFTPPEPEAGS
jgi:hypothetical protein